MLFSFGIVCVLFLTSTTALYYSVKKNLEFIDKFEDIGASVESALDVLEENYKKIDKKSKMEVFLDDPVVRDLLNNISECRDAVHVVAVKIFEPLAKVPGGNEE